jgi:tryptophan synthase alpha chain
LSRIDDRFSSLRTAHEGAFIPYVCAGDPNSQFTVEQVLRLSKAGADIIELGLPFSDPVADGPVIQAAMGRAIAGGFMTDHLFEVIRSVRAEGVGTPLVVMSYFNPLLQYGVERFCETASKAGADGLLVVDLPPEESEELNGSARSWKIDVIRLVAPSTSDPRLETILSQTSGFVYAVSAAGTTGERASLAASAGPLLQRLRSQTDLPIALGFGISNPTHVREALALGASGVVEGSALISSYSNLLDTPSRALDSVERHARGMKVATLPEDCESQSAQR